MHKTRLFRFITLVIACLLLLGSSQPALTAPNQTTRVSVASDGGQANDQSGRSSISADGRFVAFESQATNLVEGGTSGKWQIYVHDRQTPETTLVSVDPDGAEGNNDSQKPSISADGRFVAFESQATNLVDNDDNIRPDVFVHDRQNGETTRVSVSSAGIEGNDTSGNPVISADGGYVIFTSQATNFAVGTTVGSWQVYLRDRENNTTTLISAAPDGTPAESSAYADGISADGCVVVYQTRATNILPGVPDASQSQIFVYDCLTGETTLASVNSAGTQANNGSEQASISGDGRFVAFASYATNLAVTDPASSSNIFVRDRQANTTTLISVASDGTPGNNPSNSPAISADGQFVAFSSIATNLVEDDENGVRDIFVHNLKTNTTLRASIAWDGAEGEFLSDLPSISNFGHYVSFFSRADNLVPSDTNNTFDVFVRGLDYPIVTVEQAAGQPDPTGASPINFTVTFSKPIDTATFDGGDVLLGGTAGATTAVVTQIAPHDGTTFNIAVSGMTAYGTVTASLPAGVVEDLDGYTNAASISINNEVTYLAFNYLPLVIR